MTESSYLQLEGYYRDRHKGGHSWQVWGDSTERLSSVISSDLEQAKKWAVELADSARAWEGMKFKVRILRITGTTKEVVFKYSEKSCYEVSFGKKNSKEALDRLRYDFDGDADDAVKSLKDLGYWVKTKKVKL
jgi:hypothetical protein